MTPHGLKTLTQQCLLYSLRMVCVSSVITFTGIFCFVLKEREPAAAQLELNPKEKQEMIDFAVNLYSVNQPTRHSHFKEFDLKLLQCFDSSVSVPLKKWQLWYCSI